MTTAKVTARRRNSPARLLVAALFALTVALLAPCAWAQNTLQDVAYVPLPGGKMRVTLKFAEPPGEPRVFATDHPPRIAIDLPGTHNGYSKRHIDIASGSTSGINIAEAADRTRVVIDLYRSLSFESRSDGNTFVLTLGGGATGDAATAAAIATDPTKTIGAASVSISNVDFHRGKNGEGRIIVSFSGEGAAVDLKPQGDRIVVDIANAKLPAQLAQKLDVLDFATPVQFVETRSKGAGAQMQIAAKAPFEQFAYQMGNQYVIEVAPAKVVAKSDPNAPPVYKGDPVTFSMQDIPVRTVLQLIADISQPPQNIVVADSVAGNLTLSLRNVPWDQALDIVLRAKGLDKRAQGNVIWIAPQREIAEREQALADAKLKLQEVTQTITDYIPVSYGKAKDIADLITQRARRGNGAGAQPAESNSGFLSNRGRISYDERTNTLLVIDVPERVEVIRQLVAKLDKPVQQVLIESRIVVATDNFAREIGAKFGVSAANTVNGTLLTTSGTLNGAAAMTSQAATNAISTGSYYPITAATTGSLANSLNVNLPASTTTAGSIGLSVLSGDYLLDLELSAGQTEGRSELISNPRVVTSNQQEADIMQGQQIPYSTISGGTTGAGAIPTVSFVDAVLELKVTPTITSDGRVFLNLNVKKDALNGYYTNASGSYPILDKREMTTSVLVDNGQTVVLGGIYEFDKQDSTTKVPFFGDIPVLGAFFRDVQNSNQKAELIVFVTPKILDESLK